MSMLFPTYALHPYSVRDVSTIIWITVGQSTLLGDVSSPTRSNVVGLESRVDGRTGPECWY